MNLAARKRYTPEFKEQAVDLLSTGKPVAQVAEELCISSNLLYNWRHKAVGDDWVWAVRSAVLALPSVLISGEPNYLLNPAHPDFKKISIGKPEPFAFDPRLLA